jgi:hypothetical protein
MAKKKTTDSFTTLYITVFIDRGRVDVDGYSKKGKRFESHFQSTGANESAKFIHDICPILEQALTNGDPSVDLSVDTKPTPPTILSAQP